MERHPGRKAQQLRELWDGREDLTRATIQSKRQSRRATIQDLALNTGTRFEKEVKETLEALGYEVSHDELLSGSQVDLVATLKGPLLTQIILIECKDTADQEGVNTVRSAFAVRESVKSRHPHAISMIVSKSGFTKTAKDAAKNLGINLTTLVEIKSKLFDPTRIITCIVDDYESGELRKSYIELSCQISERGQGTVYKPVESFIDKFLETSSKPGLAVLGNFGSGKTSLCGHYAYQLAKRWGDLEHINRLPLLIRMRDLDNLFNLEEKIVEVVRSNYDSSVSLSGIDYWLKGGSSLIILDGFDEMASNFNRKQIADNLAAFSKFVQRNSAKFLITCRTHFFKNFVEEDILGDVIKLYICEWGTNELINYVKGSVPHASSTLLETIGNTYNLHELAKTPIFLKMIVETSSDLRGHVNPAKLYKLYTDRWIDDQQYRSSIPSDEKLTLMQEIAMYMDKSGASSIAYREIPSVIQEYFGLESYERTSQFDSEVRTCSFLIRDDDGIYRFSHKSFSEFFVASNLAKQIKSRQLEKFEEKVYSKEICGFIANYFENEFDMLIGYLFSSTSTYGRCNACSILTNLSHNASVEKALLLAFDTERNVDVKIVISESLAKIGTEACINSLIGYCQLAGNGQLTCVRHLKAVLKSDSVCSFLISLLSEESEPLLEAVYEVMLTNTSAFEQPLAKSISIRGKMGSRLISLALEFVREIKGIEAARDVERFVSQSFSNDELELTRKDVLRNLRSRFRSIVDQEVSAQVRLALSKGVATDNYNFRRLCANDVNGKLGYLVIDEHLSSILDRYLPSTAKKKVKMKGGRGHTN